MFALVDCLVSLSLVGSFAAVHVSKAVGISCVTGIVCSCSVYTRVLKRFLLLVFYRCWWLGVSCRLPKVMVSSCRSNRDSRLSFRFFLAVSRLHVCCALLLCDFKYFVG